MNTKRHLLQNDQNADTTLLHLHDKMVSHNCYKHSVQFYITQCSSQFFDIIIFNFSPNYRDASNRVLVFKTQSFSTISKFHIRNILNSLNDTRPGITWTRDTVKTEEY